MGIPVHMLLWAGGSFLLGGVMFSQLLPKLLAGRDVAWESDDNNPGSVNVFKLCGVPLGLLCLTLDFLKGFLPVYCAKAFFPVFSPLFAVIIAAPVLGHAVGVFNHFHGGKCIATAFGVLAALMPETWIVFLLGGLYLFFCVFVRAISMRKRSRRVFFLFGLLSTVYFTVIRQLAFAIGCGVIAAVAVYRHRKKEVSALEDVSPSVIGKP